MVKTTKMLQEELASYGDPANKIARLARAGELVPVVRGTRLTLPLHRGCSPVAFTALLTFHSMPLSLTMASSPKGSDL